MFFFFINIVIILSFFYNYFEVFWMVKDWNERSAHYYNGLDFLDSYSKIHSLNILFVGPKGQLKYENNDYNIDVIDVEDADIMSLYDKISDNDIFYDLIIYYPYWFVPTDHKMLELLEDMAFQMSSKSHKRVSVGFYGQVEQNGFVYDDVRFYSYKYNQDSKESELHLELNFEGGWTGGTLLFIGDVLKEHYELEKQNIDGFSKKFRILPKS